MDEYKTIIFDCDGVVLNSNRVKTEAFYQTALPYGSNAARELVKFHLENGGISRYVKFKYFLDIILGGNVSKPPIEELLNIYAENSHKGLLECDVAPELGELRNVTFGSKWLIVSGGDQQELRNVFGIRKLIHNFDGGVFGSPETKEAILAREIECGIIKYPALFLGDSKYDHLAASVFNIDFIFISGWTEFSAWKDYCETNGVKSMHSLSSLLRI